MAPSTDYRGKHRAAQPDQCSPRTQRDETLKPELIRVYEENRQAYGTRKVWKPRGREGVAVARCTVERWMSKLWLAGARHGKPCRTTPPDELADKPEEWVTRHLTTERPHQLWLSSCPQCLLRSIQHNVGL